MRVMVTGGAGYIGSVTSEVLLAHDHDVVVFDNLFQGHRDAVPDTASWVQGDLSSPDQDRKSTRLNSSHSQQSRMPSSA